MVTVKAKLHVSQSHTVILGSDLGRQEQHCPLWIISLFSLLYAGRGAAHNHKGGWFVGIVLDESVFSFLSFFFFVFCEVELNGH